MITHRADSDWERFSRHDNTMSSFKSEDTSKTLCLLNIDLPLFSLYVTSVEYSNMYSMCMLPMSLSVFVLKSSLFSPHFLFIYCYFHSDFPLHYHLFPVNLSILVQPSNSSSISYARRCTEACLTGSGGRFSSVQEGAGFVCSPKAWSSIPPGLQNQHRPRRAAALQGFLLQGTGSRCMHTYRNV